jgi:hypothetical protein
MWGKPFWTTFIQCVWEIPSPSLWYHCKKSKPKSLSAFCAHPWPSLELILHKTCNSLNDLARDSAWNLQKFTWTHSHWTRSLLQTSNHFALHCKHLFVHLWTFYTIVLQFLHSLQFGCKPYNSRWISAALMFSAGRKWLTVWILQLVGLWIAGHIITHSTETRTNTRWPVMWWFTRQWVTWYSLPRMRELSPDPTLVA